MVQSPTSSRVSSAVSAHLPHPRRGCLWNTGPSPACRVRPRPHHPAWSPAAAVSTTSILPPTSRMYGRSVSSGNLHQHRHRTHLPAEAGMLRCGINAKSRSNARSPEVAESGFDGGGREERSVGYTQRVLNRICVVGRRFSALPLRYLYTVNGVESTPPPSSPRAHCPSVAGARAQLPLRVALRRAQPRGRV